VLPDPMDPNRRAHSIRTASEVVVSRFMVGNLPAGRRDRLAHLSRLESGSFTRERSRAVHARIYDVGSLVGSIARFHRTCLHRPASGFVRMTAANLDQMVVTVA